VVGIPTCYTTSVVAVQDSCFNPFIASSSGYKIFLEKANMHTSYVFLFLSFSFLSFFLSFFLRSHVIRAKSIFTTQH